MALRHLRSLLLSIAYSAVSVMIGLVLAGIIVWLAGRDPGAAFVALLRGSLVGGRNIELTVLNAIPLVFTGLSVAIAFRAGLFNIGAEGQVMVGGIAATAVGASLSAGSFWTPVAAMTAGTLAGIVWAFPAAWLRGRRGVHEVITTLMLSYIALYLTSFARRYPLFDPASTSQSSITVPPAARLPSLDALALPFGWHFGRVHLGLLVAIAASIGTWFLLHRTVWGYEIRAVGSNAAAAEAAGIDGGRTTIVALCVGGALAGLGGAVQLLGLYYRISTDSFVGLGFAGFFIALVAYNNPLAVLPAALFFGALRAGGLNMQFAANVPINVVELAQGLIILVLATPVVPSLFARLRQRRPA
jgi:ABC-type uncharacterized transport system permease subunit